MNADQRWHALRAWLKMQRKYYHIGEMCSIAESVQCEAMCESVLIKMRELETED